MCVCFTEVIATVVVADEASVVVAQVAARIPSIVITQAEERAIVVSLACPSSIEPTPRAVTVVATIPATGSPVQLVRVPEVGVQSTGVMRACEAGSTTVPVKVGEARFAFNPKSVLSARVPARSCRVYIRAAVFVLVNELENVSATLRRSIVALLKVFAPVFVCAVARTISPVPATVCQVAVVPLVAVRTCPEVGAVAADTLTVVVAERSAGACTTVITGVVVVVATVASAFAEVTEVTVPVHPTATQVGARVVPLLCSTVPAVPLASLVGVPEAHPYITSPPVVIGLVILASIAACSPEVFAIESAASAIAVALPTLVTTPVRLAFVVTVAALPEIVVWSPVFVPLEVPENVPLCVASVPSPRFVRAVPAFVRSERLFDFSALSVLRLAKLVSIIPFELGAIAVGNIVIVDIFYRLVVHCVPVVVVP